MRVALVLLGLLMAAGSGLWTLQGLGYVGGSAMSGQDVWAIVGPLLAGFGVALAWVAWRGPGQR